MNDDPVIHAAVSTFGDNAELRVSAAGFLRSMRKPDPQADQSAIARWADVDARKKTRWKWLLWLLLPLAASLAIASSWEKWRAVAQHIRPINLFQMEISEDVTMRVSAKMTPEQRFKVFGNETSKITAAGKKAVWLSKPNDPALYAEYINMLLAESKPLPADFLETARKIDPQNAWFLYLAAAAETEHSVKGDNRKGSMVAGKMVYEPQTYTILDPAKFEHLVNLVHEAAKLEKCDSYSAANTRVFCESLKWNTLPDCLDSMHTMAFSAYSSDLNKMRMLADALGAKATQAESAEAYADVKADAEAMILKTQSFAHPSLLRAVVRILVLQGISENLATAAGRLDIPQEAARWNRIHQAIRERKDRRYKRDLIVSGKKRDASRTAGFFLNDGYLLFQQAANPPPLSDDDLKPGLMMEHELLSEAMAWVVFVLMILAAAVFACFRFRSPRMIRVLAVRVGALLKPMDWFWIVAVGVVAPFIYVMAVNHLTPYGGRQFSVLGTFLMLPTCHFIGLVVLWLIAAPMMIGARLAKSASAFHFHPPHWTAWLALLFAIALVPVIGWSVISGMPEEFILDALKKQWVWSDGIAPGSPLPFRVAMGILAVPVTWLVVSAMLALLGWSGGILRRAVVARAMLPVCACAMGVCVLSTFGFAAAQDYWFRKNTPLKVDPSVSCWTLYEHQVAVQMDKELREILDYEK